MTELSPEARAVYSAAHAADSKPSASLMDAVAASIRAAGFGMSCRWSASDIEVYLTQLADEPENYRP